MLDVTQEAPFIIVQSLNLARMARKDKDLRVSPRPPHAVFFCSLLKRGVGFTRASSVIKSFFRLPGG